MANTDKNIIITPNIGSSTADPNIVFTGGNANVASSINMTMYASGTLSWDGTAGQLFSITNSLTGTIFSVNDISGIPSITVNSLGNIVLAQYSGNVTIGAAQGQASNVLSVAGNLYTFGNSYVAQNQFITGNIVAYGSNDLFGGRVGIGTTSIAGANSNVLSVYGTTMIYGNIDLGNPTGGTSGIYFADGTYQTTASTATTPAGNNTEIQFNNGGAFGASTNLTWDGTYIKAPYLNATNSVGDEGGEILLAKPATNTTISGTGVTVDVYQNRLRFFEQGGSARGYYIDITAGGAGASTNLSGGGGTGNYSNTNVASYLSGPVQVGNLTINNTTTSTSTLTGALLMGGGAGIQGAVHIGGLIYGASTLNIAGAAQVNSLISNGAISGTTINGTSATVTSLQNSGTETVNALIANVYGRFGQNVTVNSTNTSTSTTTGALVVAGGAGIAGNTIVGGYGQFAGGFVENSTNIAVFAGVTGTGNATPRVGFFNGNATQNWQIDNSNGVFRWFTPGIVRMSLDGGGTLSVPGTNVSTSTTTGAFILSGGAGIAGAVHAGGLIYGASTLNIAGAAQVNSLISNGAVSGTTGTFTGALYGASFNTAGTATVNALVSNGAISGTTITGTSATVTSLQNSGTTTTNALISNIFGRFGQNVTVNSTNTSTSTTTGALIVGGGAGIAGAVHAGGLIYGASTLNIAGAAQVNSLISNGAVSGTTGTFTGALYGASFNTAGTATVNSLVSNGAVSGTTGTFTGALYGASFNTAGTATVNALVSNTDVKTATVNASSTIVGQNIYSNGFVQAAGTVTGQAVSSNTTITAGTGLTVTSGGISVTGTSSFTGNVNITGNVNVTGAVNSTASNILVVQDPLIFIGANNPGDTYDLGIVGSYTEGSYFHTGIVRNAADNFWTVFDTLTGTPNVITGNINWNDSTLTYGPFKAGNIVIVGNTASTGTTSGALIINGTGGLGVGGRLNVGGSAWFSGTLNAGGTAIVNSLTSNGAINGTTINGTAATVTSIQSSGTATVNSLVSNGAISGTTINGTAATVTSIQNSGQTLTNSLVANVFARFGQNVEIDSSNASTSSTTGALQVAGGVGISGNINVDGANNLFTNRVGIGTSTVLGARANVLAVYGSENIFGNLVIANTAAGGSGIYFPDGSYQQTASAVGGVNQSVQFNDNGLFGGQTNFIYDKTNVRLGIGTTNLTNSLMVFSATPAWFNTTNGADQQIIVGNSTSTGTVIGFNSSSGTGLNTNGYISAIGAAARNISITRTGTGIGGVTLPQNTLEIGGTTIIGGTYSGNNNFINPPSNGLSVQGSVGVGTFTPISTLDVRGGGAFTGAVNVGGTASVNALVSNGAVSGTTGTFTGALYGANFNTAGTATVNSLVSNGAVSGTTGTFTSALYGASFNTAGTATVNALVSNGAVSGTTGTFTGALYGGSFNTAGTATVNALVSNGAVSGTTGTFTSALYSASFNTAGTATVNALVSNGAISGTTGTFTSLQNSGITTTNALISNVYGRFGQNVTVNSTNASTSTTTGALVVAGGAGIAGNLYVGSNVVAAGFNYNNGQGPGFTSVLDDISTSFDGVRQTFNLTVNGSTVSPKNPNLLQIWIGGVNVYPAQYVTDVQNLPAVPTFTRGFVVYNNTIIFATAPQPYMDFYGTVRTNNDVMPTFTYKQLQFSAINIMMGY